MLDSKRLHHFLAVLEHGSLGQAATELHLTQPALSKSIHQLENRLNVKLFERTPTGVVPTIYGEALSLHAKIIESELRNAERELVLLSGAGKGEIQIGMTPSITINIMAYTAARLAKNNPGIQLNVFEGLIQDHIPALRRGELDVIVGGIPQGTSPDLKTEIIYRSEVNVLARAEHPLCGMHVDLTHLLEHQWVMPIRSHYYWLDHFERTFISNGLSPPAPTIVSNSTGFIKGMLLRGDFLSYLPKELLLRDLELKHIKSLDVDDVAVQIEYGVTYRERSELSAVVNVFIETLQSVCKISG